jgi:Tfp pilus assembly protein PilN
MQQINLYLPEFRPNREPLRSVHMVWGGLALIVLLIVFSVYSAYKNDQLEVQLATEKQAMESLQQEVQKLSAQQASIQPVQLDTVINRLQGEITRRKQILALISNQDFGNTHGFSTQLEGLARQSLESLALESFSLQLGGGYVEMAGKTHQPDQIPLYLQRLRSEQGFANARFGVLNVERNSVGAAWNFQVAKPAKKESEK